MKNFFTTSLKSIKQTGTISPSSRHLVGDMLKNVHFTEGQIIVEFGTGDGCITEALLEGMKKDSRLISFELNDDFFHFAQNKFAGDERVEVYQDNALNFDSSDYVNEDIQVDYVISSLPLSLLKKTDVRTLLKKVKSKLKPGGLYIQYQYSLGKLIDMKKVFDDVSLDYTLLNIPPAFVYTCVKQA